MFFRIIGILWILLGIWWIMKPQIAKRVFIKKVKKSRKKILFLVIILISGLFLSAMKHMDTLIGKILIIMGILGFIKAVFIITSKSADKIIDWWQQQPLWVWRIWAGSFIIIGILFQRLG